MAGDVTAGLAARVVVSRPGGFGLDLAIDAAPGRTVALLGPNGAGKSTAVAALAGLVRLGGGRIVLDGRTLDDPAAGAFVPAEERAIGVVFQDYLLFPHLSVLENVAFGLRARGTGRSAARQRASEWLARLAVAGLADRRPGELSGGQAQRVALARALAGEPKLLLLDEPLAALDATARVETRRLLADHLASFAGARLLISHDPTEAFLLANEIHVIEGGAVTQVGSADDIRMRPRTRYAADLAGSNLFAGEANGGLVVVSGHDLHVGDTEIAGPVLATVHPRAIALHRHRPEGSPRNTWETAVARVEHYGDRVRVQTGRPLPLTAEITPGAEAALELRPGAPVWLSIKATEIGVEPR